ncbi:GNAT family N-acetyltransferase [Klenkia marina]|uniref:GNAT family N-acetyltransferase n=1 Tax=Klenkia marina TaxID=1960309 RepID=UPI00311FEF0A
MRADPDAFASALHVEAAHPDEHWRAEVAAGVWFLSHPLGLAHGTLDGSDAVLSAMWVSPTARGHGVGVSLVGAVVDWATAEGADRLLARVFDDAPHARALYGGAGFVPEPTARASRWHPPRTWRTWALPLPVVGTAPES